MLNFEFVRGKTTAVQFQATMRDTGAVVNLTGGKVYFTMKYDPERDDDAVAVAQYTSPSNGITIDDAVNGLFTVTIQPSATGSLPNRRTDFAYDLQFKDSGGAPYAIGRAVATMLPAVTITTA